MTSGVQYYVIGYDYLPPLMVSLYTLRRFYRGPITIAHDASLEQPLRDVVAPTFDAALVTAPNIPTHRSTLPTNTPHRNREDFTNSALKTAIKAFLNADLPYDRTLWLDADTLVEASLDQLFAYPIALTGNIQDGDFVRLRSRRVNHARIVRAEVTALANHAPFLAPRVQQLLAWNPPVINSGVYVISRSHPLAQSWAAFALFCAEYHVVEEIACLVAAVPYRQDITFLHHEWNSTRWHCPDWTAPKKVRHYSRHGWHRAPSWRRAYRQMTAEHPRTTLLGIRA